MILECDVCGRFYEGKTDCHDMGEINICCDACLWEISRTEGEPKPKHTCSEAVVIPDCRRKEVMVVKRKGGDISITFYNVKIFELIPYGMSEPKFECWIKMKRNNKFIWDKILNKFREIQELIV